MFPKSKPKGKEIEKVRNADEAMQSLLDDNAKEDGLPPVLYSEYKYESILKYYRNHKELPVAVVDLWMLAWVIGQGDDYGEYCNEHFAYYLED